MIETITVRPISKAESQRIKRIGRRLISGKSIEDQAKEGLVMLWGFKKLSAKSLEKAIQSGEYTYDEKAEKKEPKNKIKKAIKEEPKVREFSPEETYTHKDLPFLKEEYERITKEMMKKGHSDEEQEKWDDLQASVDEVIENLEATQKFAGSGIVEPGETDIDSEDISDITGGAILTDETTLSAALKGKSDVYICPLCKVQFSDKTKMKRHQTTKKHQEHLAGKTKEEITKINEAMLIKARKGRSDKEKIRKEKKPEELRPYYKIGPIPSGFREARQDEALKAGKYGEWGKYKIDAQDFKDWQTAHAVYEPGLDKQTLTLILSAYKTRLKNLKQKYHYYPHGFSKLPEDRQKELLDIKEGQKKEFEVLNRLINKYYKDYQTIKGVAYEPITFTIEAISKPPKPQEVQPKPPSKETSEKEPEIIKKPDIDPRDLITEMTFSAKGQPDLILKKSHFKDGKLKPKIALKLFLKNIRIDPEYYTEEDKEKYFFKRGGMLGMYNYYMDYRQKNRTFTTKVQKLLKRYGDENIHSIVINRTPVQAFITPVLNVLTLGDFKKKLAETPYDKLYHLRLEINGRYTIEKNEVINMDSPVPPAQPDTQKRTITAGYKPALTLNKMIANAIKGMGQFDFFNYSATKNNCQDFCIGLLKYSGIGNKEDYDFIKQDVESVFKGYPTLSKFMDKLTGFAGEARTLIGGDIESQQKGAKTQSVLFSRPEWTEEKAVKWLQEHHYTGLVVDRKKKHLRYRQMDPKFLLDQGYHFRTLVLPDGIELIIGYKKTTQHKEIPIKRKHD